MIGDDGRRTDRIANIHGRKHKIHIHDDAIGRDPVSPATAISRKLYSIFTRDIETLVISSDEPLAQALRITFP